MSAATQIQFLGHASFRLTSPESRVVLIDPWFTNNPFVPAQLWQPERADLVLITHGHDDHFDPELPGLLARTGARCIAPAPVRYYLYGQGVPPEQFEPMNLGGSIRALDMDITMTLAFHGAHIDLPEGGMGFAHEAVGYVLGFGDGTCVYAAGDTAVFGDMRLLADLYAPNVALLPIGNRYTMGPREAALATRLLGVTDVVPFHYGTYPSLVGTPEELRTHLAGTAARVHALQPGEVLTR